MFTELTWLPEKFFVFFIQSVRCIFSLSVTLHSQFSSFRLKLLPWLFKFAVSQDAVFFCQRFLNGGPTRSASLPDFLVYIRRRLSFQISAKKRQRIASSSSGGISSKRLASLRWSFHSLKTFSHIFVLLAVFEFSFLFLRVLISSSCSHGNPLFVLELLKMKNLANFLHWIPPCCQQQWRPVLLSVLTFAHCWLVGFTIHCFSRISLAETNCPIFSQIGQFLHFYSNSMLKTVQIKSEIGQFWEIKG